MVCGQFDRPDYQLHRKKRPWTNWTSYFGRDMGEHSLVTIAQAFREKMLMVGDDLSDIYRGSVTHGLAEGKFQIDLMSPECPKWKDILNVNKMKCIDNDDHSEIPQRDCIFQFSVLVPFCVAPNVMWSLPCILMDTQDIRYYIR